MISKKVLIRICITPLLLPPGPGGGVSDGGVSVGGGGSVSVGGGSVGVSVGLFTFVGLGVLVGFSVLVGFGVGDGLGVSVGPTLVGEFVVAAVGDGMEVDVAGEIEVGVEMEVTVPVGKFVEVPAGFGVRVLLTVELKESAETVGVNPKGVEVTEKSLLVDVTGMVKVGGGILVG